MNEIEEALKSVERYLSLSAISEDYFAKRRSWFHQKLHQSIINGVRYSFSDEELMRLRDALNDICSQITDGTKTLDGILSKRQRCKGKYYTQYNPFTHCLFRQWHDLLPKDCKVLEPFAGACNIPLLIQKAGFAHDWDCYDVERVKDAPYKVVKRDTISKFPKAKICITNPPFLAKNSASRQRLDFPQIPNKYKDLYQLCLELMLKNCQYVAAIVPESFISSQLFQQRLFGIVSLIENAICEDTDIPLCLALFIPQHTDDFTLYIGEKHIGTYNELKKYDLSEYQDGGIDWHFNSPNGSVGIRCTDSHTATIEFIDGLNIKSEDVIHSSRAITRVDGLPTNIDCRLFIRECNRVLTHYREFTHDVFLTPFKGLRNGNVYRRRLDFQTARRIMNKAYHILTIL